MSQQLVVPLLIGLALGLFLFYIFSRLFSPKTSNVPGSSEKFSAAEAEQLLTKNGYEIVKRHPSEAVICVVDGKEHYGNLEADYLVSKGGKELAVVVHFGEVPADSTEPVLRRRLLEIQRAFSKYQLLLLDLNNSQLHKISFRFPHEQNLDYYFRFFIALFIIAGVIGIILVMANLRLI